jgi:DNA gyrase/topoisomerase IV subunit A
VIKPSKIQEWIEEIEDRPLAAPFIVRTLSARVIELDKINEELRAENISLRSGHKTEEYERRIAELEYQIELLKRQVSDGSLALFSSQALLFIYDTEGRLVTCEFSPAALVHNQVLASIQGFSAPHRDDIHILAVDAQEELLLQFDSGRIETRKAEDLPHSQSSVTNWEQAFQIEMRSGERLIGIQPITNAPLKAGCIQISRKGLARHIPQDYFQSFLQEQNLGKGVRTAADQPLNLVLGNPTDIYVLVSRSGYISALPVQALSITLGETIKLDMKDYLVSAFIIHPEEDLVCVLESGEIYLQKNPWNDPEDADGSKRRLLLGGARASGVQMVGAGAASTESWVLSLTRKGEIRMTQLSETGKGKKSKIDPPGKVEDQILAFSLWETQAITEEA